MNRVAVQKDVEKVLGDNYIDEGWGVRILARAYDFITCCQWSIGEELLGRRRGACSSPLNILLRMDRQYLISALMELA